GALAIELRGCRGLCLLRFRRGGLLYYPIRLLLLGQVDVPLDCLIDGVHHEVPAELGCPPTIRSRERQVVLLFPSLPADHRVHAATAALATLFALHLVIVSDIDELVARREALVSQRPADAVLEHGYGERLGFLPVAGLPLLMPGQA